MSHAATNWAITQRGLKPAAKIVLWHLADCHNPSYGCFPSQDYLADRCEMSRSSLNEHLATLESAGLIRREQRRDRRTRRQENTRYRLAFEADFAANPCPETGHGSGEAVSGNGAEPCPENGESRVQNPDTNPVREPVREPLGAQEREREGEIEDRRKIEADGWALLKDWPGFAGMPKEPAFREWLKLDADSRANAKARFADWLALLKAQGKSHVPAPSTYLRERLFDDVPDAPAEDQADVLPAPPWGPHWAALCHRALVTVPPQDAPAPASAFMRDLLSRDDEAGRAERMRRQAHYGWPMVNAWHEAAANRKASAIRRGDMWLSTLMESVPVGTPTFEAWRAEYQRRGWPWIPDPGGQPVVYFPKGGPGGLDAFEAAITNEAQGDDGGDKQAAE
ncbi:helix-turn-helix domain-containing protein [Mesorhizobium sp. CAU 1741]|uniref:helix-turn-helix domain-containing protein n=1 Tax=Mesorhizobium sp. CAU 1741 TaxID=3140366 RepID=UPI00325A5CF8